jgi:hypothetical protein
VQKIKVDRRIQTLKRFLKGLAYSVMVTISVVKNELSAEASAPNSRQFGRDIKFVPWNPRIANRISNLLFISVTCCLLFAVRLK